MTDRDPHSPVFQESAEAKQTGRIEAFSDGVIAIAITLLVLELKVPHVEPNGHGLIDALVGNRIHYLAYFVSFWSIGLAWLIHHNMFTYIRRTDHILLLLNILLLVCVSIVPHPTAIVAEYLSVRSEQQAAVLLYSATWFFLSVMLNVLWWYARSRGMVYENADPRALASITNRIRVGPPLYLLAIALSFVSFEAVALIYVIIGIAYTLPTWAIADRWTHRIEGR